MWPLGAVSIPPAPQLTQLETKHTFLVLALSLCELPHTEGPLEFGAHGSICESGAARKDRHTDCVYLLCSCACSVAPSEFTYKIQVQRKNI